MKIGSVLLELVEQIKDDQYTDELKTVLRTRIKSSGVSATTNPRDKTDGNRDLLSVAMLAAFGRAQDLYGDGADIGLHPHPIFSTQWQSQIAPLQDDHSTFGITLGLSVKTWEDVFYDVCHESLHLLNPVIDVRDSKVKVCALEEGVAVKFAEQMYEEHIKRYCDKVPATSPVNDLSSQYFKAYSAAKKIPDDTLKEVRGVFGKFSIIDDPGRFKGLVGSYLSEGEIDILLASVRYH